MKPDVIAVAGPTASGKTALAIKLAKELNGEIVSADSRLVYRGFDIAAAKPDMKEREGIRHYLIDIVEPEFDYTAGNYHDDARKAIYDILSRNKTPIIAGGTGLYFKILLENYNLPRAGVNYALRKSLDLREKDDLLEELKNLDKNTYERLKETDKRRIVRALEVIKILNKPISDMEIEKEPEFNVKWISPEIRSRQELYGRINARVDDMLEKGLVDETKYLLKKHGRIKNFTCTIGYREILSYLDRECTLEEAVDKLKQHSRNYAKRQLTWFRRNPELKINI